MQSRTTLPDATMADTEKGERKCGKVESSHFIAKFLAKINSLAFYYFDVSQ